MMENKNDASKIYVRTEFFESEKLKSLKNMLDDYYEKYQIDSKDIIKVYLTRVVVSSPPIHPKIINLVMLTYKTTLEREKEEEE